MKHIRLIISILVFITFFVSSSSYGVELHHHHHEEDYSTHSESNMFEHELDKLELNDGAKWQMDEHTRASFFKMAGYFLKLDVFSLDSEELKTVGSELQLGVNELVTGCTMSGDAHDQLHVFLLSGYIPAVADLFETGGMKEAKRVKFYLETYSEYFE